MRCALFASVALITVSNALQKTVCNGAARTTYGRSTARKQNSASALTNSAPAHQRPLSHAVAAATPRSQRLRLAAAPDVEEGHELINRRPGGGG